MSTLIIDMRRVTHVQTKPEYILIVTFDDGTHGEVCLADELFGPMFEPLKDPAFFDQARVNECGVVCWPNDADLDSQQLYEDCVKDPFV